MTISTTGEGYFELTSEEEGGGISTTGSLQIDAVAGLYLSGYAGIVIGAAGYTVPPFDNFVIPGGSTGPIALTNFAATQGTVSFFAFCQEATNACATLTACKNNPGADTFAQSGPKVAGTNELAADIILTWPTGSGPMLSLSLAAAPGFDTIVTVIYIMSYSRE